MLPSMMSAQTFTRRRFPTVIDHGSTVRDYTAEPSSSLELVGSIQPGGGAEDRVNRNGAEVIFTIFAPDPLIDVSHYDLIRISNDDYYVNGEPDRWQTGIMDHAVIYLSRWIG